MKQISLIVAMDLAGGIGMDNNLPWKISEDLKRFKKLTTGNVIIMGRKTFESLPKGALPDRENIVLSHTDFSAPGAKVVHSLDEAMLALSHDKENFVIGGGSIYRLFLPFAQKIYLTIVQTVLPVDTHFPPFDMQEWEHGSSEFVDENEKNQYSHQFQILTRK